MADRFVFGLEKLLDIRVKKEEESIREFQEVTRQIYQPSFLHLEH